MSIDSRPHHAFQLPSQAADVIGPPYRTLQGWALGTLIEQGAVEEGRC
jgi:hypothetical protein